MRIIFAVLIKRKTDDNAFEIESNIKLGKIYVVDADSIVEWMGINIGKGIPFVWKHTFIFTLTGKCIPLEMLRLEESIDNLQIKQSQKVNKNG